MLIQLLQMTLPVLVTFCLGYAIKRFNLISLAGMQGLKALVSKITLPVVLFNAFLTANYSGTIFLTFALVFISCVLGLCAGFALRKLASPHEKYLPFLVTNFEGGMLGYALFGLLFPGETATFALFDIGQTFCAFTVFLVTLKAANGERSTPMGVVKNMATNPVFIGCMLGALLGLLGVGNYMTSTDVGIIFSNIISFISAPTSAVILLIVGYDLSFEKSCMRPVFTTLALRVGIMALLLMAGAGILFMIIPFSKPVFIAMLLAYSLPAPYIIPLFMNSKESEGYVSTTLSLQTLLSILFFMGISFYTLMS